MMKAITFAFLLLAVLVPRSFAQSQSKQPNPRSLATGDSKSVGAAGPDASRRDAVTTLANSEIRKPEESSKLPTSGPVTAVTGNEKLALTEIYRVGVGDVLDIRMLNSPNSRSTLFTVMNGGSIDMPIAGGQIVVAGLTTDEIQRQLAQELKRRAVEDSAKVSVGVRQFGSHSVVLSGLVANPGTRYLRREAMSLYVLLAESQVRSDAGRVAIMRRGVTGKPLDLSEPAAMDVTVMPGDVVLVSARPQEFYFIAGRIISPGQKPFHKGITLWQAILAAGGTQHNESIIDVSREGAEQKLITTRFNLKQIKSGQVEDPKLEADDRIEVVK